MESPLLAFTRIYVARDRTQTSTDNAFARLITALADDRRSQLFAAVRGCYRSPPPARELLASFAAAPLAVVVNQLGQRQVAQANGSLANRRLEEDTRGGDGGGRGAAARRRVRRGQGAGLPKQRRPTTTAHRARRAQTNSTGAVLSFFASSSLA